MAFSGVEMDGLKGKLRSYKQEELVGSERFEKRETDLSKERRRIAITTTAAPTKRKRRSVFLCVIFQEKAWERRRDEKTLEYSMREREREEAWLRNRGWLRNGGNRWTTLGIFKFSFWCVARRVIRTSEESIRLCSSGVTAYGLFAGLSSSNTWSPLFGFESRIQDGNRSTLNELRLDSLLFGAGMKANFLISSGFEFLSHIGFAPPWLMY